MKRYYRKVLPETDVERTFVPVKKMAITAKKYLRKRTFREGTVRKEKTE